MYSPESEHTPSHAKSGHSAAPSAFEAPSRLTTEHRLEFRRMALEALEISAANGAKLVQIDLGAVIEIDASGLGVLILVQKRARERGLRVRLTRVPMSVASLLDATRLEPLFEVERAN